MNQTNNESLSTPLEVMCSVFFEILRFNRAVMSVRYAHKGEA